MMEDPAKDVFITNITIAFRNFRIFEAIWNHSSFYVQTILDVLFSTEPPESVQKLLMSILSLLRLSDQVAERLDLFRWVSEESNAHGELAISKATNVVERSEAVTLLRNDRKVLVIDAENLERF